MPEGKKYAASMKTPASTRISPKRAKPLALQASLRIISQGLTVSESLTAEAVAARIAALTLHKFNPPLPSRDMKPNRNDTTPSKKRAFVGETHSFEDSSHTLKK
jgi:hypothetical protein